MISPPDAFMEGPLRWVDVATRMSLTQGYQTEIHAHLLMYLTLLPHLSVHVLSWLYILPCYFTWNIIVYAWGYMHYQCHSTLLLFTSYCPYLIQLSPSTTSLKESRYLCARAYAAFLSFLSFLFFCVLFSFHLSPSFFCFLCLSRLYFLFWFTFLLLSFVFCFLSFTMDTSGLTPTWLSFGVLVGFSIVSYTQSRAVRAISY